MNSNGILAERLAANYLRKKRYKLVDYNYSTRFGEIDLIVRTKSTLVFVEVKARKADTPVAAKAAVDAEKQRKIILSAQHYLHTHPTDCHIRFDVIEVYMDGYKATQINHIENAFGMD